MIHEKNYSEYHSILFQLELDGSYTATHPELPGCVGTGLTMSEALFNLNKARDTWIEAAVKIGRPVPPPHILSGDTK